MKKLLIIGLLLGSQLYPSDANRTHMNELETEQFDLSNKHIWNNRIYYSSVGVYVGGLCMKILAEDNEAVQILGFASIISGTMFWGYAIGRDEGLKKEIINNQSLLTAERLRLASHSNSSSANEDFNLVLNRGGERV